jgi:tetratricopeptide (TPR) repeat protein
VRSALAEPTEEALAALERIARAREGLAWRERGRALERDGDLAGAIDAFEMAVLRHPALAGAVADAGRARRRLSARLHEEALLAVREGGWRRAAASLEQLLEKDPGHADAVVLLGTCRREIAAALAAEARSLEGAGLPAGAIIRCHLALGWDPCSAEARGALGRLEADLQERLRPGWRVVIAAEDAGERRSRRDLWGVGEDVLLRLERAILESAQAELDAWSRGRSRREAVLTIEDMDFSRPRAERSRGAESTRFVEAIAVIENPDLGRARSALAAARRDLAAAEDRARSAPLRKASLAGSLARIARLQCAQAEGVLQALPALVVDVEWGAASHPTAVEETRAELACRYRTEGESRWVEVSIESRDRIVAGDPARGVPPDPEEGLSRSGAIRILGGRLGRAVARDAIQLRLDRQEAYYRDALASLEAGSVHLAVESLVAFLYSRRGLPDPLAEDAARRLEDLTGCDLPAAWKARGPGR